jgi:hypothetical protein
VLQARLDEGSRLAQEDAADERAREGQTVRVVIMSARNGLLALHAELIHEYQRTLARLMQDPSDPDSPKAKAARRPYREIVEIVARLAEAAERGQRMERVLLGEPTAILGVRSACDRSRRVTASPEELAEEVAAAQRPRRATPNRDRHGEERPCRYQRHLHQLTASWRCADSVPRRRVSRQAPSSSTW